MKKQPIVILLAMIAGTGNLMAQAGGAPVAGEKKGWPSSERYSFISNCIGTAKQNIPEDAARYYCYCMEEKIEKKYPNVEDAGKISDADLASPWFKKYIADCTEGSNWDADNRNAFVSECVKTAQTNLGEEKAKNYCECMLFKVEKAYPNMDDATKNLTAEKMNSPEWKKIAQGCLDF